MGILGVQRYRDLVDAIPTGEFYPRKGILLPYKSIPTELRLETSYPNTKFGIYLNEAFIGEITSDVNGNVIFSRILPLGEVEVTILNSVNGQKLNTWLTVRDYALWLIAYAEVLETIDDNIQRVNDSLFIEDVQAGDIEDRFGKHISTYNNMGQSLDTYRNLIHELRMAYRNTGTRYNGLEKAVSAFTQVPPFGYQRRLWGPNWWIDQSMLINHRYLDRSHSLSTTGNITGVSLDRVEPDVVSNPGAPHQLDFNFANNTLTWTPDGSSGPAVEIRQGELFLPGPNHPTAAYILGRDVTVPYTINVGVNDMLYFNIDDVGTIAIQLVTGLPNPTVANVVFDINTALVADTRYGAPYAAYASAYNAKLLLQSPVAAGSQTIVEHGPDNAGPEIFGVKPGNMIFNAYVMNGVEIKEIRGNNFRDMDPNFIIEYEYDGSVSPVTRRLRWRTPLGAFGAWVPITANGTYNIVDSLSNTVRVYCYFDEMDVLAGPWPAVQANNFTVGFNKHVRNVAQTQGLWIYCDTANLPGANQTDIVTVFDDINDGFKETPDNWQVVGPTGALVSTMDVSDVVTAKDELLSPTSAFKWDLVDATITEIQVTSRALQWPMPRPGPRGRNYPQRSPGLFYDYEGYEAVFSGWVRNMDPNNAVVTLSFSYDGGATWLSSIPVAVTTDTGGLGYEDPTFVTFSTIIPAGVVDNDVLVRVEFDVPGGAINVSLDGFALEVKYISSRYLARNTVVRHRQRQYFGEYMLCWCPDPLTLKEEEYIGLQHKAADRTTVFSGVVISAISFDTSPGTGTVDYEYNSLGDVRRLRWSSSTSAWGAGLGWVPIVSTGSYNLAAPDGSFITVDVVYNSMSLLDGTPPATMVSRNIEITDISVNQGHVRRISPAHASIDIFNVTEFNASGLPINLKGAITEADFSTGTVENLDLSFASPFRFSYLYPSREPVEDEVLTFSTPAPFLAPLAYNSDEDQVESVLLEDGLPVPNDSWQFTASNQVQVFAAGPGVTAPFNPNAEYTISYGLLYQYTTAPQDLVIATYQDYAWFADYYLWDRMDSVQKQFIETVPLFFNIDIGRAYLTQQSSMDTSKARIIVQDGSIQREVPKRYWRFVDRTTVEVDSSQLTGNVQYWLEHEEERVYEESRLTVTFEHRSGTSTPACLLASWNAIERNENVEVHANNHVVHQLRLTVEGIRDVRDFRIRSLVLKGLHIHGASPNVPGLTNLGW